MAKANEIQTQAFRSFIYCLTLLDVEPSSMEVNYKGIEGSRLIFAFPRIRAGIAVKGDNAEPLEEAGWKVVHLNLADLAAFHKVFEQARSLSSHQTLRGITEKAQFSRSHAENVLLERVLQLIPETPDQNYTIYKDAASNRGDILTCPDMTWPDIKLAFFVDGEEWHAMRQNRDVIRAIKEGGKDLERDEVNRSAKKLRKDARQRSELVTRGWTVLSCTAEELFVKPGQPDKTRIEEVSQQIRDNYERLMRARRAAESASSLDLLGGMTTDETTGPDIDTAPDVLAADESDMPEQLELLSMTDDQQGDDALLGTLGMAMEDEDDD